MFDFDCFSEDYKILTMAEQNNYSEQEIKRIIMDAFSNAIVPKENSKIEKFDGQSGNVLNWIEDFELISEANSWNDSVEMKRLPLYLEKSARDWQSVYVAGKTGLNWSDVKVKLREFFLPASWTSYLRKELRKRVQSKDEPVVNYILAKKALCSKLDDKMTEEEIMDYLYEGIIPEIRSQLTAHNLRAIDEFTVKAKLIEKGLEKRQNDRGDDAVRTLVEMMRDMMKTRNHNSEFYP